MNNLTRRLNLLRRNNERLVTLGFASQKDYEQLNELLNTSYKLENEILEQKESVERAENELKYIKDKIKERVLKENKKRLFFKKFLKGYLFIWLMKK